MFYIKNIFVKKVNIHDFNLDIKYDGEIHFQSFSVDELVSNCINQYLEYNYKEIVNDFVIAITDNSLSNKK